MDGPDKPGHDVGDWPSERVLLKTDCLYERDAVFHGAEVSVFRLRRVD